MIIKRDNLRKLYDNKLYVIFEKNHLREKLAKLKDIKITLLEGDFLNKIEQFNWEYKTEKRTFVKEMIALSLSERRLVFEDMMEDIDLILYSK